MVPSPGQDSVEQVGAKSEGWEVEVKKQLGNLELLANYTDLRVVDDQSGERLPYIADRLASAWGKYELENGLRFGAGVRYVGDNVGFDYAGSADGVGACLLYTSPSPRDS